MMNQTILSAKTKNVWKYARVQGEIELTYVKRSDWENTEWVEVKYDGHLHDGTSFELKDRYPIISDARNSVTAKALGCVIGLRVRQFEAQYKKEKKAQNGLAKMQRDK